MQADAEACKAVWNVWESLKKYHVANCGGEFEVPLAVNASCERRHEARNALVHEGVVSRNMATHAVRLSLAPEEALMAKLNDEDRVGSWMVPDPVVAERWHSVSHIRQALLSGSYTVLSAP